jgi:hypothetical protein
VAAGCLEVDGFDAIGDGGGAGWGSGSFMIILCIHGALVAVVEDGAGSAPGRLATIENTLGEDADREMPHVRHLRAE